MMSLLSFSLAFILFLNLTVTINCININNGVKVDCNLRAEPKYYEGGDPDSPYMRCFDQQTSNMHKCEIESCSDNPGNHFLSFFFQEHIVKKQKNPFFLSLLIELKNRIKISLTFGNLTFMKKKIVCDNCLITSSLPPRQVTNGLTCLKSYIIPQSNSNLRNLRESVFCDTDSGSYTCAGPCRSFKYCRNCVP
ncbi:hypothetical protein PPACK8108_LOCUS16208 [Phakopsora pachyrhizi]|uniref:Uncharacterized protein n=1 Tax=Phakopsora pachyrhizi TaxID=170000 RepID=A0AAV0BBD6_PHAPC|nr:hypothetical protein PPACK8108_LOCUS16208 [Phakopsora pachyrhizi]